MPIQPPGRRLNSTAVTTGLLLWLTLAPLPLTAGGSSERVVIDQLAINGVDYTLVLTPSDSATGDPYLGHCRRFEVRGTYRWLRGAIFRQEPGLSRAGRLEALAFRRRALEEKRPVELGWIGTGFVPVDPAEPCIVRSRALRLLKEHGRTYVVSYHNSTSGRSD
jgi:hypothetical protein